MLLISGFGILLLTLVFVQFFFSFSGCCISSYKDLFNVNWCTYFIFMVTFAVLLLYRYILCLLSIHIVDNFLSFALHVLMFHETYSIVFINWLDHLLPS